MDTNTDHFTLLALRVGGNHKQSAKLHCLVDVWYFISSYLLHIGIQAFKTFIFMKLYKVIFQGKATLI